MHRLIAIGLALLTLPGWAQDAEPQPGLALTWQVGDARAVTVTPNLWLYVPEGQPPSPHVPGGRFTATYEGFVNIDLRGDYSFHATGKGGVKLEVNNAVLLDLKGIGGVAEAKTQSVRLNKGGNPIKVTHTSPVKGDAQFRLSGVNARINPCRTNQSGAGNSRICPLRRSLRLGWSSAAAKCFWNIAAFGATPAKAPACRNSP